MAISEVVAEVDGPSDLNRRIPRGEILGLPTNVCGHPYSLQIRSRGSKSGDRSPLAIARKEVWKRCHHQEPRADQRRSERKP
jgi:hypothetical protein